MRESWTTSSYKTQDNPEKAHGFLAKGIGYSWNEVSGDPHSRKDAHLHSFWPQWQASEGKSCVTDEDFVTELGSAFREDCFYEAWFLPLLLFEKESGVIWAS